MPVINAIVPPEIPGIISAIPITIPFKKTLTRSDLFFFIMVKIKNIERFSISNKYLIFSGIGNSTSFKEILENNNFIISEEKIFTDHYDYKIQDIQKILEIAKYKGLKILTT